MTAPIRTRTRRAPAAQTPAVQPVSNLCQTIDLLDQPACHHRTDFDELERRLYLSSDPAHWAQAAALENTRQAAEERIYAEYEEKYGDLDERQKERLALRGLVRKLVARLQAPLEIKIELTLSDSGGNDTNVTLADQAALDELLEEATEVMDDFSVHQLEDGEK